MSDKDETMRDSLNKLSAICSRTLKRTKHDKQVSKKLTEGAFGPRAKKVEPIIAFPRWGR